MHNAGAIKRFDTKKGIPREARLLFAGVTPAARRSDGAQAVVAPDGSRILEFDARGRFIRSIGDTTIGKAIGVVASGEGWIVVEREGSVLRMKESGTIASSFGAPFGTAVLSAYGDGFVAVRSPFAVATRELESGDPLVALVTASGQLEAVIDTVIASEDAAAGFIANSGLITAHGSMIYFASFTRDEIRAYDSKGRLRWISDRGLRWPSAPTAEAGPSGTNLKFNAVNLGITADESGVYVLSYADSSEQGVRLDRLDGETGVLNRSIVLAGGPFLLSLDSRGSVWSAPLDTLFALATPRARATMPDIRLATLTGEPFHLRSTRGRVTLLNFWASWCPPCREEFPLMNQLSRDLAKEQFTIVAVNEDVDVSAAQRFLSETPANFTIPLGKGAMQALVGYRGLPYTVLLDREGRIIERYFGFGGPTQFSRLRSRIDEALRER